MTDVVLPVWSVHSVFVQANVVHGYRYLDLTGVLLNIISDRYKKIDVISPGGTSLSYPLDVNDPFQLQFENTRIWLHYVGIDATQKIEKTAPEMIKSIAEKLEMQEFVRYGVRIHYFIKTTDVLKAAEGVCRKIVSPPIAELIKNRRIDIPPNLQIPLVFKDMEVILRFSWVVTVKPPVNPGDYSGNGLILDIDVGQRSDATAYNRRDLAKLMSNAIEAHTELLVKYGQPLLQGVDL
ncbi:MAG: hypothetical protein ABSA18_02830 [Dehalococcoidia bacterium]|jgi:hypothetical protein